MLQEQLLKKQKKVFIKILYIFLRFMFIFNFCRKLIEVYVHHKYTQLMETEHILNYLFHDLMV